MGWALFFFYMAGVSDAIRIASGIGLGLCLVACIAQVIQHENLEPATAQFRRLLPWVSLLAAVAVFAPSRQFLYIAAGLTATQELADSPLAEKAYGLLDRRLDEMLNPPATR